MHFKIYSSLVAAQVIIIFMPLILNIELSKDEKLRMALGSNDFKIILSSCISLSIPFLLEIFRDCLLSRSNAINYHALLSNVILVMVLLFPDIVVFVFVLPERDARIFVCVHQFRTIAILSVVYGYLYSAGGDFFKRKICSIWYIFGCISQHLFIWQAFQSESKLLFTAAEIFLYATGAAFVFVAIQWIRNQYGILSSKIRSISTNEYFCSVYICSSVLCFTTLALLWLSYGRPGFDSFSSDVLIGYNVTYGLFYVLISVFHQGLVRRDLFVEVRQFLLCKYTHQCSNNYNR